MTKIISFLSGKKAYAISILMVILGLLQGDQKLILDGLAVAALRAGISKVQ